MKKYPFSDGDSYATFRNLREKVIQEIKSLDNEYVLQCPVEELETYYLSKAELPALMLHTDRHYIARQEPVQVDVTGDFNRGMFPGERAIVAGTQIEIAIPYEGDSFLWRIRPSMHNSGCPEIQIDNDHVSFEITFADDTANSDRLRQDISRKIESLAANVKYLGSDLANHLTSAKNEIKDALTRKRALAQSTTGVVAALGIPMKRRGEPAAFVVPAVRRKSPIQPPKAKSIDPFLAAEEYEFILKVLRSTSLVFERNPKSFATLEEEDIRNHFLIQLNGHYEGSATGETFNASGKTDILIRANDRNVFIAECKFWRGPQGFDEAIDQLLRYLSWRDSKTALLIFNRTKGTTAVRDKMHEVITARQEHRKTLAHPAEGDSQYVLVNPSDEGRELIITTQVYDFPVA